MKTEVVLSDSLIFLSFRRKPKQYTATELPVRKIGHETHTHTHTNLNDTHAHTHTYDRNTHTHIDATHTHSSYKDKHTSLITNLFNYTCKNLFSSDLLAVTR